MQSLTPVTTFVPRNPSLNAMEGSHPSPSDARATQQVAKEFESVFATILLKEMRATLEEGTLFEGDKGDVYGGIFDLYLGQSIAESGGLGIAEMLNSYLQSQQEA